MPMDYKSGDSISLRDAYSGQSRLTEAKGEREQAMKRLYGLVDARQRLATQVYGEAEDMKRDQIEAARNPTTGVLGGAAVGSKFGVVGGAVGAAVGAVGEVGRNYESYTKQMKEEGRGKGWRNKKMANQWLNPAKGIKNIVNAFRKDPKGITDAVGAIGLGVKSDQARKESLGALDAALLKKSERRLEDDLVRDRLANALKDSNTELPGVDYPAASPHMDLGRPKVSVYSTGSRKRRK